MSLCARCQEFDIQSFRKAWYQTRGFSLQSVQKGLIEGCHFCQFLRRGIEGAMCARENENTPRNELWIHLRMSQDNDWKSMTNRERGDALNFNRMDVYLQSRHHLTSRRSLHDIELAGGVVSCRVLAELDDCSRKNGDISGVYLGDNPGSIEHNEAIKSWLAKCLEQHAVCRMTLSGTEKADGRDAEMPTRCINVLTTPIRLEEFAPGQRGSYVTLSHRWTPRTVKSRTTMKNLKKRLERVKMKQLTKTFKDAIQVTQRLDISHLWIDSLCIIQEGDGKADWRLEAPKMGQYYQNSKLTIAAVDASDRGFLRERVSQPMTNLVRLPYLDKQGAQQGCFYVQQQETDTDSQYWALIEQSPLMARGWVLQEWLLSRRIVYYTGGRVFFECQADGARNRFGESVRARDALHEEIRGALSYGPPRRNKDVLSKCDPRAIWCQIIEIYSGLKFTEWDDRIVGIAGLAREVRAMMTASRQSADDNIEYASGWWLHDIHNGLLWEVNQPTAGEYEPKVGVPFWSWAAWTNSVNWRNAGLNGSKACRVRPIPSRPSDAPGDVDYKYQKLELHCKRKLVILSRRLSFPEARSIAAYTGVDGTLMSRWRALADAQEPDEHIGWANMDADDIRAPQAERDNPVRRITLAVHISTLQNVPGGLKFGRVGRTHEVYCVLFVEPSSDDGEEFKRAGVGRIFKMGFFDSATETTVQLI